MGIPEPNFERFVSSVVQMWIERGPSSYPGAAVERLTSELLVIRGDRDHLFSRADAVRFVELVRGASLANTPYAGHATHEDQPRLVAEILTEFYRTPARASK